METAVTGSHWKLATGPADIELALQERFWSAK